MLNHQRLHIEEEEQERDKSSDGNIDTDATIAVEDQKDICNDSSDDSLTIWPQQRQKKSKSTTNMSLSSSRAFKSAKEKERSSFFVQKKGLKRAKPNNNNVKITIAVMKDVRKIEQGDSLPLKVPASSSGKEILDTAVMKHATFNKHFNSKLEYALVFKDETEVTTVPGTDPSEQMTLYRSNTDPSSASTSSRFSDMQPTTSTSTIMTVDCPLCFKSFPITEVEQHADGCSALFGLIEESNRDGCVSSNENSAVELANIEESGSDGGQDMQELCEKLNCAADGDIPNILLNDAVYRLLNDAVYRLHKSSIKSLINAIRLKDQVGHILPQFLQLGEGLQTYGLLPSICAYPAVWETVLVIGKFDIKYSESQVKREADTHTYFCDFIHGADMN
ncbi:Hypothetical predicted protein, partial [Paramuricea clavata]